MRKSILTLALSLTAILAGCSKPHERLVVYTAAEADQIQPYAESFKKARPDIDLVWVRDSTGVVTAKLLAEQKAPQADVVFALAATSMMKLDDAGLLVPYAPKGLESVDARFRDGRPVPHWTGEALWSAAICVNTDEMRKRNLPTPATWEDVTKPIYKGLVSMPDPASSGTGLLAVAAWLQLNGEEKGWAYMDRLNPNVAAYVHSGSKPCKDVSRGEIPVGISIDFRAAQAKTQGLPVQVVIPKEGVGWDLEATGLVTGTKHEAAAKAFIDWAFSHDAMALYAKNFGVVGDRAMPTSPILPADLRDHLASVDLKWTAANRDRILTEWAKRYGAKSEPKS